MTMTSYHDAAEYLGRKDDRPLPGRATRLQRRPEGIAVRYQATDVVLYRADGSIRLDSGGWRTPTTKARITEYSPISLYQSKGRWYVGRYGVPDSDPVLFEDGMIVGADGEPRNPRRATPTENAIKRQLDRAVARYIKGFAAQVAAGVLPQPNGGDCWGCLMQVKDAPAVTQGPMRRNRPSPHGRVEHMGIDHYLSHLGIGPEGDREVYYVPSLLVNAIKARGYGDGGAFVASLIWQRNDARMAGGILRAFFRDLKPALLEALTGRSRKTA